jgi:hypothetical protein
MVALLSNSFENTTATGDDGDPITIASSDDGGAGDPFRFVSGDVQFDTGIVIVGTRSALLSAPVAGNTALFDWDVPTPVDEIWIRHFIQVNDATPTSDFVILDVNSSNRTSAAMDIRLRSTGKLRFRIPSSIVYSDSTYTLVDATKIRLETHIKALTATTVAAEARLFYGANLQGITPDETFGDIATDFTAGDGLFGRVTFGIISTTGQAGYEMTLDDVAVSIDGWLGPSVPPVPVNVVATPVSSTAINVNWDDFATATGYDVERDGVVIATDVSASDLADSGLLAATTYDYRVRAVLP